MQLYDWMDQAKQFKYISCYSLSVLNWRRLWKKTHLNTSHVILYQILNLFRRLAVRFKYISCYSLSRIVIQPYRIKKI